MKKIFISSDHAGFTLKKKIVNYLIKKKLPFKDLGPFSGKSVDYPIYAHKLANNVKKIKKMSVF